MKYFTILLILSFVYVFAYADDSPNSYGLEIFIRTINTGGNTVTITASTSSNPRWSSHGWLTTGMASAEVVISGDYSSTYKGFDLDSSLASLGYAELGKGYYLIEVSTSLHDKTASFFVRTNGMSSTWDLDLWVVYDYGADKFYKTGYNSMVLDTAINGTTRILYTNTSGLQPTDPANLSIQWSGGHPLLQWTASSEPSPVKYHIWRANQYIAFTTGASYADQDVVGGGGPITYKVRAVSYDETKDSQNFTNSVTINGLYQNKRGAQVTRLNTVAQYELGDNYPNPFNPTTRISYSVAESRYVSLKIYNTTGREIAILVDESKEPGSYTADWNAQDVPSGNYFYRIVSGKFSETKKMLFMK